jgi:hypothetical protein
LGFDLELAGPDALAAIWSFFSLSLKMCTSLTEFHMLAEV